MTAADDDLERGDRFRFVWEQAVRAMPMDMTTKCLALLLATYGDANGSQIYPSVERLAANVGRTERTVNRAMADLRDRELISLERRGNQHASAPSQRTTRYRLSLPSGLRFMPGLVEATSVSPRVMHRQVVDNQVEAKAVSSRDMGVSELKRHL